MDPSTVSALSTESPLPDLPGLPGLSGLLARIRPLPRGLGLFPLGLAGCLYAVGGSVSVAPDTGSPANDTARPESPDTGDSTDTGTATEELEAAAAEPVFQPPGGAFLGSTTVTLSSSTGEGELYYCQGTPSLPCELLPYEQPFTVDRSTMVYARVDNEWAAGEVHARSFFELDAGLEDFSSDVPIIVFWTGTSAPTGSTRVSMGMDVFDPGQDRVALTDEPTVSGRGGLKVRGSSSSGMSKRPYDLEIWEGDTEQDREVPLLGMPEEADWVFYAPYYYDEALIRNSLGYELSNDIGRYASRTRFAELFVAEQGRAVSEDDYVGVYAVIEEIEQGEDRVDVTPIDPADLQEPEITGGYVFKRDRAGSGESGFYAGEAGGAFSFSYPLVWVDPEEDEVLPPQEQYLVEELDDLAWALVNPDFTSPYTGRHYSEIIDVDAWIDHNILNILVKNPDAFRLSGFMFKDREAPIEAGPLWDLDRTMGANDYRVTDPYLWDASSITSDTTEAFSWGWYAGLFDDPDFRDRYWARWTELLEGELSIEHIHEVVDRMAGELDEAGDRNYQRWSSYSSGFDAEIANLKVWLQQRHDWISNCIETYDDPRRCGE